MPLIKDLMKENDSTTKFKKKSYRPWDDDIFSSNIENDLSNTEQAVIEAVDQSVPVQSQDIQADQQQINYDREFRNLYGVQKLIIAYFLKMIESNDGEYYYTKPIVIKDLSVIVKSATPSIHTSLQRLKQKGLIASYDNKRGKGGYGCYKIKADVFHGFQKKLV
jgi:predicted transcriptional regulator